MTILTAACCHSCDAVLGEGPVWDAARQCLWWVDIERMELHRFDPATGNDRLSSLPHRVGFAVPTRRGDLIVGTQRGLARFATDDGTLAPLADPERHLPGNRFNDAKCDPAGRLWAGTMAVTEEAGKGSLYRMDGNLHITRMIEHVSISNGLAWSPNGRTMFYVDSPTRRVDAFDFEPASGELANRRTIVSVTEGFPDGMCSDAAGNLWVALWGGWGVACHDPHTGECLAKVELPVEAVTSCCFGGAGWDELFITTASRDLDTRGRQEQPLAGSLFVAKPAVPGVPTRLFAG